MALYLVLASSDLRPAIAATGFSFYMPFDRVAVVSYAGAADQLLRHLDIARGGGPGALVVTGLSYGALR